MEKDIIYTKFYTKLFMDDLFPLPKVLRKRKKPLIYSIEKLNLLNT